MPTALITGITGQDGLYLAELLLGKGYEVHGVIRGQNNPKRDLVRRRLPGVRLHNGDLTDLSSLMRALRDSRPDEVYNLGAVSFVAYSWENAHVTTDVTARGVLNMLEAVRLYAGDDPARVRFYQASSSEMFGKVQESPQHERTLLWPRSPYGVSKVFGHHMTINYRESYGMHASSGILFNHESPLRGPEFVTRKISRAAARISLGLQDELVMGNLDARAGLGLRGRLRRGDVADAPAGPRRRLRGRDRRDPLGPRPAGRGVPPGRHRRLVGPGAPGPGVPPPGRGRRAGRRRGKAREVLGWKPRVGFEELVAMMVDADLAEQKSAEQKLAGDA